MDASLEQVRETEHTDVSRVPNSKLPHLLHFKKREKLFVVVLLLDLVVL